MDSGSMRKVYAVTFYARIQLSLAKILLYFNPSPAIYPAFANSVDPDQLASDLDLHYLPIVNLYQQPGSSNLIG